MLLGGPSRRAAADRAHHSQSLDGLARNIDPLRIGFPFNDMCSCLPGGWQGRMWRKAKKVGLYRGRIP